MSQKYRGILIEFVPWFVVGITALLLTFTFNDEINLYRYGANLWPALISITLLVCVAILFIHSVVSRKIKEEYEKSGDSLSVYRLWATFAIPVLYVIGIPYIGFYIATIIFLPLYSYVIGKYSIIKVIAITLPVSFIIIFIFTKLLFVPFPTGSIEIFYLINSEIVSLLY